MAFQTILDSTDSYDAYHMGFDRPCDPREDSEGLIVRRDGDHVEIKTEDGCITLWVNNLLRIADEVRPKPRLEPTMQVVLDSFTRLSTIGQGTNGNRSGL